MRPIERGEVLRVAEYEAIREAFRTRVISEKKIRRISLGDHVTAVFENRDTVLLQIQEMLRTERITREAAILHEIETYNQLVPRAREVSATLMIEYDDKETRERQLVAMEKIEETIRFEIGAVKANAIWDPSRVLDGRASAVLYLRFSIGEEGERALANGEGAKLVIDHPSYRAEAELPKALVASLVEDLADA